MSECCGGGCCSEKTGGNLGGPGVPQSSGGTAVAPTVVYSSVKPSVMEQVEIYRAETDRMGLLFSILQRELDADRKSGEIHQEAKKEYNKLAYKLLTFDPKEG